MRNILFLLLALVALFNHGSVMAQAPAVTLSRLYGGTSDDHPGPMIHTFDSGYLFGGWVESTDGQVSGFHGGMYDGWLVKTDSVGNIQWSRTIGGTSTEQVTCLAATYKNYIVAGYTKSIDGDFDTIPHTAAAGFNLGYVAWLNPATGATKRIKSYSGGQFAEPRSMAVLENGNIALLGRFRTVGEAKTLWVTLLDSIGNIIWQKKYGTGVSTTGEYPVQIIAKKNGGFIVLAQTNSNTGDVHGLHGSMDAWLLNLDDTGGINWAKCYGGSLGETPYGVHEDESGRIICGGITNSTDFDVTGVHGEFDFWAFKTDDTGMLLWSKVIGGTLEERMYGAVGTCDGGIILSGHTRSNNGDVSGNHGLYDALVARLSGDGTTDWVHCYGSTGVDFDARVIPISGERYAMLGHTGTTNGDVSGTAFGNGDIWLARLGSDGNYNYCPPPPPPDEPEEPTVAGSIGVQSNARIYPNPVANELMIEGAAAGTVIKVLNMLGQQVFTGLANGSRETIRLSHLPTGNYIVQLADENGNNTSKLIVKE